MGTRTTPKELQLVIDHFKNGKSLLEMTEVIQRTHFTVQHVAESYKRKTGLRVMRERDLKNLWLIKKMDSETLETTQHQALRNWLQT
jgi:orotate phosphoribosyltransferase